MEVISLVALKAGMQSPVVAVVEGAAVADRPDNLTLYTDDCPVIIPILKISGNIQDLQK